MSPRERRGEVTRVSHIDDVTGGRGLRPAGGWRMKSPVGLRRRGREKITRTNMAAYSFEDAAVVLRTNKSSWNRRNSRE